MPVIASIFGFLSSAVSGLFGFKGDQAKTVQSALDLLKSINDVDGQSVTAASQALSAILTQGSWLEKNWRPMLMVVCIIIILASFFGFVPSHFNDPVTPMMDKVWTCVMIGLGGYIPCRTIEKVITQINIGSILKALIAKKLT